jgi:hypothetical protein
MVLISVKENGKKYLEKKLRKIEPKLDRFLQNENDGQTGRRVVRGNLVSGTAFRC